MALKVVEFQGTPNPNALKCVVEGVIPPARGASSGLRSYSSPDQASNDPLALAILRISGVRSVLIEQGWATLVKAPEARWDVIRAQATRVLEAADAAG